MTDAVELTDYPFLSEIPNHTLSTVDLNVLRQLSDEESLLVQALASGTCKNIVVYKKHFKPTSGHLCKQLSLLIYQNWSFGIYSQLRKQ